MKNFSRQTKTFIGLFGLALGLFTLNFTMNAETEKKSDPNTATELATLGGGCFWCVEAVFERLPGVKTVVSGYAGGKTPNPTYKLICTGETGHAEVVQIAYDPKQVTYEDILNLFWRAHDPTTLNRQGADVGTQYRSIILYHNDAQKAAAEKSKQQAQAKFKNPITTEIAPLTKFYEAEVDHQDYYRINPKAPYCVYVIQPKLEKLGKEDKASEKK